MKVIALFATISTGVIAFTPQASPRFATNLSAKQEEKGNNLVGGAVAFFTGLTIAGQVAFADPVALVDYQSAAGTLELFSTFAEEGLPRFID
jgi:hypothetical protein